MRARRCTGSHPAMTSLAARRLRYDRTVKPRLHVAFGRSETGDLEQALASVGSDERVICEPDDLGYGPIHPFSTELRAAFEIKTFGDRFDTFDAGPLVEQFWRAASEVDVLPVAWLSRRCVREYAGFLEFLSRRDEPPLVVDIAEIAL